MKKDSDRFGIPKKIKVGGHVYDVEMSERFKEADEDVNAQVLYEFGKIQIPIFRRSKKNTVKIYKSLLHELCHSIDAIYTGGRIELLDTYEDIMERIDTGWMQILSDNNLHLKDEYKMPEVVRVGGMNYKIDYPYQFSEVADVSSHVDTDSLTISISDSMNGLSRSPSVIKINLLIIVFNLVCINYKIDFGTDDVGEDRSIKESFVNGLYQVLVDNDLEKLFYSGGRGNK